jgi:hypothetical protein
MYELLQFRFGCKMYSIFLKLRLMGVIYFWKPKKNHFNLFSNGDEGDLAFNLEFFKQLLV